MKKDTYKTQDWKLPISNGMNNKNPQPNTPLKDSVLTRLESEQIRPMPKMWWQCLECSLGIFWLASVFIGAVSVAVLVFAATHMRYALFEATHDSALAFLLEALPYVWLGLFVLMGWLAHRNIRHTKRGYRHTLTAVLGSSLLLSILGGLLLHAAGAGEQVDTYLGKMSPLYLSQEQKELRLWQQPTESRLVGAVTAPGAVGTSTVVSFTDMDGEVWRLETADLRIPDMEILHSGRQTRVLGVVANTDARTMHACGVFPWLFDQDFTLDDMEAERRGFVERMYAHKDQAKEREQALKDAAFGTEAMGLCADMPTVERIGESMR